jgi:transposase InsO family protein
MDEKTREQIALFRYGLIAPIISGQVASQKDYLAQVAGVVHQVPCYGPKEYTAKTIDAWLRVYRREGFDGLKPKARSDKGLSRALPVEVEELVIDYRKENLDLPLSVFHSQLIKKGIVLPSDVSYHTVRRVLKKHGLSKRDILAEPNRKRFAHEKVNALWQGDMSVGPYLLINGKKVKTFLFAFIDDCSRLVPYAMFLDTEKFSSLKHVFKEALIRRGIPKIIYVDNGKVYRSNIFQVACATLGITLTHTKPYDAASKGKIERFFGTVKGNFFPLLRQKPASSLNDLNSRFWTWLEEEYHRKIHSAVDMSPLDKYLSQVSEVRFLDDPASLDLLFLQRALRKVKHDGTLSVDNRLYEVPATFINQSVEVRYDENQVLIFQDGVLKESAKLVNFADNAHSKRQALSFSELSGSSEEV